MSAQPPWNHHLSDFAYFCNMQSTSIFMNNPKILALYLENSGF